MAINTVESTENIPNNKTSKKREWPTDVDDLALPVWDAGVFHAGLGSAEKAPKLARLANGSTNGADTDVAAAKEAQARSIKLSNASYRTARLALSKAHDLIESRYSSFLETANIEPSLVHSMSLDDKRMLFRFTDPATDSYPPHLDLAVNKPYAEKEPNTTERSDQGPQAAFDLMRLIQMGTLLPDQFSTPIVGPILLAASRNAVDIKFGKMGRPDQGKTLKDVEDYNAMMRAKREFGERNDIFNQANIADLPDWYSDQRFAQQQFTGTNPTTIEKASQQWLQHFGHDAFCDADDEPLKQNIRQLAASDADSLYVQDYSDFRGAAGLGENDDIAMEYAEKGPQGTGPTLGTAYRYGVASVCLFHLAEDGMLSPLAIVVDWRGSAQTSVTIYNKRLSVPDQAEDWPWRYAKTCVSTSDWTRHEIGVHLVRTHFVEEATIVAAQRSFEDSHPLLQLLYPHWQKTLSINAGARSNLVPNIFTQVLGFSTEQVKKFIVYEARTFDFEAKYVPSDLANRGFPVEKLNDPKYRNYAYARCIYSMWFKLREYVEDMLSIHYRRNGQDADLAVQADAGIQNWSTLMRRPGDEGGADIPGFPLLTTFAGLVDCVTMCIHIASPQHTAVNYLQNYFQAFVPNRPPCMYRAPPASLAELKAFTQADLVQALPMNHPREWLLASHIPYLLSNRPGEDECLIGYAASKYFAHVDGEGEDDELIARAAKKLYTALADSEDEFSAYGRDTWDAKDHLYHVLSPSWNAVAIVI